MRSLYPENYKACKEVAEELGVPLDTVLLVVNHQSTFTVRMMSSRFCIIRWPLFGKFAASPYLIHYKTNKAGMPRSVKSKIAEQEVDNFESYEDTEIHAIDDEEIDINKLGNSLARYGSKDI